MQKQNVKSPKRVTTDKIIKTMNQVGSVSSAANFLKLDESVLRRRLINHYKRAKLPHEHLDFEHVWLTVNQYLDRPLTTIRNLMREKWFIDGVAICHLGKTLYAKHPTQTGGVVVGVYTSKSSKSDMLDDLYWYITNEMEAKNDSTKAH